jgi:hypothetical protein
MERAMALRRPDLRTERIELLDQNSVLRDLRDRSGRDRELRLLSDEAQRRGGRLVDRPESVFGYRHTFESTRSIRPPRGRGRGTVTSGEFEILVEEYANPGSADQLAVGIATLRGGDNIESYPLLLEAPDGNFVLSDEYTVIGDAIEPTESWWTAVTGCLSRNCVTVCANSLFNCRGSWIEYLGCVAWNCGGCWVTCAGCATCNCGWWCGWAVGCCQQ